MGPVKEVTALDNGKYDSVCALLLGIRADSTLTEAVLADPSGRRFGHVKIPNGEARSSRELLERAFQEASIDYAGRIPPLVAVTALPGLHSESIRRAAAETVKAVLPKGSRAVLCDDLEPMLAAGLGGETGLLLVSGQQAAVASVDREGVYNRAEEPAEELGQEGSGLWLGTRTLQLAARLLEGRLPESARLIGALTEHFGKRSLTEVWDRVMTAPPDPDSILGLAKRTIALAENPDPDPACRALLVRAARRLGELVAVCEPEPGALATWQGVTATGALLDEVRRLTPELVWQPSQPEGMDGCFLMARAFGETELGEGESEVVDAGPPLWLAMRERKNADQRSAQGSRS